MSKVISVNSFVNNCLYDKGKNVVNRGGGSLRAGSGFQVYFEPSNVTFQIYKALSALVILY